MQRFTNVKMNDVLGLCATSMLISRMCFSFYSSQCASICLYFYCVLSRAYGSGKEDTPMCDVPGFENCRMKLLRHVSFVDCPVSPPPPTCVNGLIFLMVSHLIKMVCLTVG